MTSRTVGERTIEVGVGPKRSGKSKGHRVRFYARDINDGGYALMYSVYPEDARKFALEILRVADECEKP